MDIVFSDLLNPDHITLPAYIHVYRRCSADLSQVGLNFLFVPRTFNKFNPTWLNDHKWMRYSVSTDYVYCVLFSTQRKDAKDNTFVSSPVCDWSNMSKLSQRHVKEGANHYACVTMGENFHMVAHGKQLCVADQFNVQH